MTLNDYVHSIPFDALVPELIKIDEPVRENLYAFKEAYDILRRMKLAGPQEESILVTIQEPDEDSPDAPLEQRIHAQHCGGDFWENDLAKEVIIEDGIPTPVALAEILWEMTFYGFDPYPREEIPFNRYERLGKIEKAIGRILTCTSDVSHKDLDYLFNAKAICEYEFFSRVASGEDREAYIRDNLSQYFHCDLSAYTRAEILLCASTTYPLSNPEIAFLTQFFRKLLPTQVIRFSIGTKTIEKPQDIWVFMVVS